MMGVERNYLDTCLKNEVFFTALQGSQNQNLASANSDVDTYTIVIPTFDNLVKERQVSRVSNYSDGENKVMDIRKYTLSLKKQAVNVIETLFTDDFIVKSEYEDLWRELRNNREKIGRSNPLKFATTIIGTIRNLHGGPDKISKLASRAVYMTEMLEKYVNGESLANCYWCSKRDEILNIRYGTTAEEASAIYGEALYNANKLYEKMKASYIYADNEEVCEFLDYISKEAIRRYIYDY